jgi:hypothetical protein
MRTKTGLIGESLWARLHIQRRFDVLAMVLVIGLTVVSGYVIAQVYASGGPKQSTPTVQPSTEADANLR